MKVLILDDQSRYSTPLCEALTEDGHSAFAENDSKSAVKKALSVLPELILLDLHWEGQANQFWDIMTALRNTPELKAIPVAFLTGEVSRELMEEIKNEFDGCLILSKDLENKEVLKSLKNAGLLNDDK